MSSTGQRTITFDVPEQSIYKLAENGFQLSVARSVGANGQGASSNLVWIVQDLAPMTDVNWTEGQYALNWTNHVGSAGTTATLNGMWQSASLGSSYALDARGMWQANGSGSDPSSITVRNNGSNSVNIVVGVANNFGGFDPIWVDTQETPSSGVSTYQPGSEVSFWYGHDRQASFCDPSRRPTPTGSINASSGSKWNAEYEFEAGRWNVQQS
ncbi:hypothetical protein OC846_004271 [Tilletia horrida]|uniref:Uncharacterized protein n=1 Tax=Tilletia horrida TaxID=155126 RepID=A0AAN6GMK7_9BASI|nr:hypothetical protein OC846_004271 [Tilletia horrida]